MTMFKHVLTATDGSELATKALEHALDLARQLGAQVTVVTVTEPWLLMDAFPTPSGIGRYEEEMAKRAEAILAAAAQLARTRQVTCNGMHLRNTRSASGIVEAARQTGCDLIVMGSHGYGAIGRVLL
jgi:nucleotide-binding universal stress UspA family protein